MATEIETLRQESNARITQIQNLELAKENRAAALAETKQLDSNFKADQEIVKVKLESIYTEKRHYDGKEPLVYTQAQTDVFPYFQGQLDTDGNPYYRPSLVIAGTDKGITPIESEPDRSGPVGIGRDQVYAPSEDAVRVPVIQPLKDYPDHAAEPLPANFPAAQAFQCTGEDNPSQVTQVACEADNGVWGPIPDPVWNGPDTAPGIVRALITAWRADAALILTDVHEDDAATEAFWQSIIDECDTFLGLLPADAVFVRNDPNPDPVTWGQTPDPTGALLTSINDLIQLSETDTPNFVTPRNSALASEATIEEDTHFGVIKLRLHSINGSFSKIKAIEGQSDIEQEIIDDHRDAIDSIERLIISKS